MFKIISMVALGGCFGATLRFAVSEGVQKLSGANFPYGILIANLIGCFLIGLLSRVAETHECFNPATRALIFTGFLGAFTTFSTFSNDSLGLFQADRSMSAFINIGVHVIAGLALVWLGQTSAALFERAG